MAQTRSTRGSPSTTEEETRVCRQIAWRGSQATRSATLSSCTTANPRNELSLLSIALKRRVLPAQNTLYSLSALDSVGVLAFVMSES